VPTDVSQPSDVEALARQTIEAFGAVHVLCNNAGVALGGLAWEFTAGDWDWVLGVNLMGVIHGCRIFVPLMLSQGDDCHVVNTASLAGLVSTPMNTVYAVAKHGVVALSEGLHHDLRGLGAKVNVSVLCPGWVNTRIMDADRNRPSSGPAAATRAEPTPAQKLIEQPARQLLSVGMAPAEVAELVFQAVRDERFYILTHPELKGMIRARMEDVLEERTPSLTTFG
jgi:NAD(P)-dependent dehydrogenase (short-subunit alcohol dehydrogenase family)